MKWTVLGVLAIFLAQSGFIAYTGIERQSDEVVAANGVPPRIDPISDAPYILTDFNSPTLGAERYPGEVNPRSATVLTVERRRFRRLAEAQFLTAKKVHRIIPSTTANFKPLIITIPASPKTEFAPVESTSVKYSESQAFSKPVAQIEQRSLVAKTFSVIKKPYDWLRLLGSKMR